MPLKDKNLTIKEQKERANTNILKTTSPKNLQIRIPAPEVSEAQETQTRVKVSRLNRPESRQYSTEVSDYVKDMLEALQKRTSHVHENREERKEIENTLNKIKKEITQGTTFLEDTKKTIDNINIQYYKDMIRMQRELDPGDGLRQTDEELQYQYDYLQDRVQHLRNRVTEMQQEREETPQSTNFEDAINAILGSFSEIQRNVEGVSALEQLPK